MLGFVILMSFTHLKVFHSSSAQQLNICPMVPNWNFLPKGGACGGDSAALQLYTDSLTLHL